MGRLFWLVNAAGLLWALYLLWASNGWPLDDELSHFKYSHDAWRHPLLLLDVWTRPGRNLIHFPFAFAGLGLCRLYTLLLAQAAVLLTADVARRLGVARLWLIPLFLWSQPWFAELSFTVMTQTPFCLALIAGVACHLRRRYILAGLAFGMAGLIRHEGILFSGLYGLLLLALVARRPRADAAGRWALLAGCLAVALPAAALNAVQFGVALATGLEPAAAWRTLPLMIYFDVKPATGVLYGSGPPWHFVMPAVFKTGPTLVALALLGLPDLWRQRATGYPLLIYPAYFLLHSLFYWLALFSSGGYLAFLMPVAPFCAVAGALGFERLLPLADRPFRLPWPWTALAVFLGLYAATVIGIRGGAWRDPYSGSAEAATAAATAVAAVGLCLLWAGLRHAADGGRSGRPASARMSHIPATDLADHWRGYGTCGLAAAAVALVVAAGVTAAPHRKQDFHRALEQAVGQLRAMGPPGGNVVTHHVYADLLLGIPWNVETLTRKPAGWTDAGEYPAGTMLLWEAVYAPTLGCQLATLRAPGSGWRELAEYRGRHYGIPRSVVLFGNRGAPATVARRPPAARAE